MFSILFCALMAQSSAPAPASAPPDRPSVTVSVERRIEHYRFRFDHPSNFDTVELVPHFYEQRYDAGAPWVTAIARYTLFGRAASTEAGVTPTVTTRGSDIDTFFQSSGDVVTSGTDGWVRWQSWEVTQRVGIAAAGRWTTGVVLGYRRSTADFLPDDIIVTHTAPPSVARTFTTDRERTVSRLFTSGLAAEAAWRPAEAWRVAVSADALPIVRARLTTSLPDKYPYDVVADALAYGARGRLTVERRWRGVTAGAALTAAGVWRYRATASYRQHGAGLAVFLRTGGMN